MPKRSQLGQTIPELRQAIGQACRQRAIELFQADRMVRETLAVIDRSLLPHGDYVAPGLAIVRPDAAFPNKIIGDPNTCPWPHLRRTIGHHWYVDRLQPQVGFLSRDEAQILYNNALQFQGKPALEIGCWLGWSACHLALAGVELDVIDPMLGRSEFYESVDASLTAAGVRDRVNLVAGYSPQAVEALAAAGRQVVFDLHRRDHDAPAPLNDAIACLPFAAPDAMIVFHDLASPDVAAGLDYLKEQGWKTKVYQTMQIMGVAWRGNVEAIDHQPDPAVNWPLPDHLRDYEISGIDGSSGDPLRQLLRGIAALRLPPVSPVLPDFAERKQLRDRITQGKTAYRQDRQEAAIAAFQAALTINPGSRIAHQHLSHLYWQQNDLPRSLHHHALALSGAIADGMQGEEFQMLLAAVRPFTLLSVDRLFSLYSLTKQICLDDVPGEIVECGTCRGGAAALLAAVVQRYSLRPRYVYAFDTFEGMPDPIEIDRHQGIPANETGFGAGTLKAPIAENLNLICEALGVQDLVIPVAGLFAETLPANRSRIGAIALLHADGDWYESTLAIFNTLYDQIVPDGVIQVDDYGHWEGCRQAIHEFERDRFTEFGLRSIDYTGVWFTKRDPAHPDCNYWRICWHGALSAVQQGDRDLHNWQCPPSSS
ncbi:MAG: macrocin O-methyltransferase [Leptolyngbyaceae cyanobacterium SM1_3_5]|nr:macrocin O-methyltransferase [Leptolyngbyaceae cyanobacterium SM1_3_5]